MTSDHIRTEEMSTLLDEGMTGGELTAHLEECASCRREMEIMRRTRMALSALDDLEPPEGQWDEIEAALERRGVVSGTAGDDSSRRPDAGAAPPGAGRRGLWASLLSGGPAWMRAAAAVLLFVGGVGAGLGLGAGGDGPAADTAARDDAAPAGDVPAAEAAAPGDADAGGALPLQQPSRLTAAGDAGSGAPEDGYRRALEQLEALRAEGPSPREVYRNPRAAAEHLARLDALIRASREALRNDPADPAVNDFLFEVVEERRALNQALQLASMEYK